MYTVPCDRNHLTGNDVSMDSSNAAANNDLQLCADRFRELSGTRLSRRRCATTGDRVALALLTELTVSSDILQLSTSRR